MNLPVTAPRALARVPSLPARPLARPWAWTVAVASVAFALVTALRAAALLEGVPAAVLATAALLAIPTAPTLAGRIFVTGTTVLGLAQLLWWVRVPGDRMGLALAAVTALAVGIVVRRTCASAVGPRSVLPDVAPVDLIPVGTFVLVGVGMLPRLRAHNATSTLAGLMPGWDNLGHFSMFAMTLAHGRTVDRLPAPGPHDSWNYAHYPESFHATAASVAQLIWPADRSGPAVLLPTYERASTLVLVLAVVVVTAGVAALPWLRARWDVATPLAAALAGMFALGLGRGLVASGFAAFVLPCALTVSVTLLLAQWQSVRERSHVLAYGAAVMAIANGWILLLPLVLGMSVVLVPGWRERLRGSRADWAFCLLVAAVSGYGVLRAVQVVTSGSDTGDLATRGFIVPPSPWVLLGLVLAPVLVLLMPGRPVVAVVADDPHAALRGRARLLMAAIPVALATACYLAVLQVHAYGGLGYYFYKYVMGVEFVLACLLVLAVSLRVRPARRTRSRRPAVAVLAAVVVTAAMLPVAQLTGLAADGTVMREGTEGSVRWQRAADQLLDAARVSGGVPRRTTYLAAPGPVDARQTAQWYLALTNSLSVRANRDAVSLPGSHWRRADVVAHARALLRGGGALVVSPDDYRRLVRTLGTERIATWGE